MVFGIGKRRIFLILAEALSALVALSLFTNLHAQSLDLIFKKDAPAYPWLINPENQIRKSFQEFLTDPLVEHRPISRKLAEDIARIQKNITYPQLFPGSNLMDEAERFENVSGNKNKIFIEEPRVDPQGRNKFRQWKNLQIRQIRSARLEQWRRLLDLANQHGLFKFRFNVDSGKFLDKPWNGKIIDLDWAETDAKIISIKPSLLESIKSPFRLRLQRLKRPIFEMPSKVVAKLGEQTGINFKAFEDLIRMEASVPSEDLTLSVERKNKLEKLSLKIRNFYELIYSLGRTASDLSVRKLFYDALDRELSLREVENFLSNYKSDDHLQFYKALKSFKSTQDERTFVFKEPKRLKRLRRLSWMGALGMGLGVLFAPPAIEAFLETKAGDQFINALQKVGHWFKQFSFASSGVRNLNQLAPPPNSLPPVDLFPNRGFGNQDIYEIKSKAYLIYSSIGAAKNNFWPIAAQNNPQATWYSKVIGSWDSQLDSEMLPGELRQAAAVPHQFPIQFAAPEGYQLKKLIFQNEERQPQTSVPFVREYRQGLRFYIIDHPVALNRSAVKFQAIFEPLNSNEFFSEISYKISPETISTLSKELRASGYKSLSNSLDFAIRIKLEGLSLSDLEIIFSKSSVYQYVPNTGPKSYSLKNLNFETLKGFLTPGGTLLSQCTVGNRLQIYFLIDYKIYMKQHS
jgi:hypothetical protein